MDLVMDPFGVGSEDATSGVWTGIAGVPGRRIVIVYVPDRNNRQVFVADINYGDPSLLPPGSVA